MNTIDKDTERRRIGARLAEIRRTKGLTQVQVSEMTGIQQTHVARIENGRYSVGLDTLAQLASALGVRVEFV